MSRFLQRCVALAAEETTQGGGPAAELTWVTFTSHPSPHTGLEALVLASAPAVIAAVDETGTFRYMSAAAQAVLGYTQRELGRNVVEFVHPDDLEAALVSMAGTADRIGPAEPITLRFLHANGDWIRLELVASSVSDEVFTGLVVVAQPIQELAAALPSHPVSRDDISRDGAAIDDTPVPCIVVDRQLAVVRVNGAAARYLRDVVDGAVAGRPVVEVLAPVNDPSVFGPSLIEHSSRDGRWAIETELQCHDGKRAVIWTASAQRDRAGATSFVVLSGLDVTAQRDAESALRASEERFRALVANTNDVVVVVDDRQIVTYASPSVQRILGWPLDDVVGHPIERYLIHPDDVELCTNRIHEVITQPNETNRFEIRFHSAQGVERHMEITAVALPDVPGVHGTVITAHDITERHEREAELERRSLHDALTGLPNRTLLFDRLAQTLHRRQTTGVAILFVDLDGFKSVNDNLGHDVGDQVLIEVARRMVTVVREADTVARLAGDEFVILCDEVGDPELAAELADRVVAAVSEPIVTERGEAVVGASVGISMAGQNADPELAVRVADQAMYRAKRCGKGTYSFSEDETSVLG